MSTSRFYQNALAVALMTIGFAAPLTTKAAGTASSNTTTAIKQINTECNAIQNAVMALNPIHVVFINSKWKVLDDQGYMVAERTHKSITLTDAWKQGKNYAWVHSHSIDAHGNQRATQLCFRQSDGTLERVRQATTVPALSAASAKQAYYASDGTIIQKTALFEVNDPAIAKKVKALPFYSVLP